jgi:hypothetical protein
LRNRKPLWQQVGSWLTDKTQVTKL